MTEIGPIQIGMIWPEVEALPVLRANQFLVQLNNHEGKLDEIILVVGHVTPPVLIGSAEEQQAMASALGAVPIKTVGRYSLNRDSAASLAQILQMQVQIWDQQGGTG